MSTRERLGAYVARRSAQGGLGTYPGPKMTSSPMIQPSRLQLGGYPGITGPEISRLLGGAPSTGRGGLSSSIDFGEILSGLGGAAEDLLEGAIGGAVGGLSERIRRSVAGIGGSAGGAPLVQPEPSGDCPGIFSVKGPDGRCINLGDLAPGGDPAITQQQGNAVAGAFGLPALTPVVAGNISRMDGSTGPILRCPSGMVLGRDNLCYPKAVLRRSSKYRKWKPGRRPLLTGGERNAISTANRLRGRVKAAWEKVK